MLHISSRFLQQTLYEQCTYAWKTQYQSCIVSKSSIGDKLMCEKCETCWICKMQNDFQWCVFAETRLHKMDKLTSCLWHRLSVRIERVNTWLGKRRKVGCNPRLDIWLVFPAMIVKLLPIMVNLVNQVYLQILFHFELDIVPDIPDRWNLHRSLKKYVKTLKSPKNIWWKKIVKTQRVDNFDFTRKSAELNLTFWFFSILCTSVQVVFDILRMSIWMSGFQVLQQLVVGRKWFQTKGAMVDPNFLDLIQMMFFQMRIKCFDQYKFVSAELTNSLAFASVRMLL